MRFSPSLLLAAVVATGLASPALADDREPTAAEREKIETMLTGEGFTTWGEIELDDDKVWEVDDARHSDGRKFDLKLAIDTYEIIERDLD